VSAAPAGATPRAAATTPPSRSALRPFGSLSCPPRAVLPPSSGLPGVVPARAATPRTSPDGSGPGRGPAAGWRAHDQTARDSNIAALRCIIGDSCERTTGVERLYTPTARTVPGFGPSFVPVREWVAGSV